MFIRRKIVRDTIMLPVMQLFLDTASLMLNAFITRKLGSSAIGVLTLTGTFLGLAGIISNGNAYLCTSRLISEELGKKDSSPEHILAHGIKLCMILSISVSAMIEVFAETISERFFRSSELTADIRLMPAALISGAAASCLKGYFNAERRSSVTAAGDILEFIVRCSVIASAALTAGAVSESGVCGIMISGIIAGNVFSLAFFAVMYLRSKRGPKRRGSISFKEYAALAFPIMGGGILTAILSSTNDALIPICLRQYGDSAGRALSLFGIFEAIVIPTLFFPSVILCSMSGIIVSETARASASGDTCRIRSLASRLTEFTLIYAVFSAGVLIRFGRPIGEALGGGRLAGSMISAIAPVIPFIYMEIVLEAMIKGMGLQGFSSLNYLAEYAVRISIVLIAVPHFGFIGIAASYYTSNVIGNISRCIKLSRASGCGLHPVRNVLIPAVYTFMTMCASELIVRTVSGSTDTIPQAVFMTILWGCGYAGIFVLIKRSKVRSTPCQTCKIGKSLSN
ncbi:MAG: oligosaccharide flippase family protein [Ruminococcus sp.]|nr:oligosaccharide flippase family protein [Ruminococcus sp.]